MLRIITAFCLFFILPYTPIMESNVDCIQWSRHERLSWLQFKGEPKKNVEIRAESALSIRLSMESDTYSDLVYVKVYACFFPNDSWVSSKSDRLLNHENGHFDITELNARILRGKLHKTNLTSTNYQLVIDSLYNAQLVQYSSLQKEYDASTNFSRDTLAQKKWNEKILLKIDSLEEYSIPELELEVIY